MTEEPINLGDETQVKKRQRKDEIQRQRELDDLNAVLDTPQGRRVMWRVLGFSKTFHTVFNSNALVMAHNEGQRNVGLWLTAEITEASTDNYLLMQKEASNG